VEEFHGKEYYVVPVVSLVEGVLQGMSSAGPELALADEFGKFPDAWNGRPAVMSHPVDGEGIPISANSPSVLETYQIGFLFNSKMVDDRLEQEAWIDKSLAANATDNAKEVFDALEKGEMIEVSTGYFAMIEPSTGVFANKKYSGIQREIVPDHLAFLPIGTFGACSNEDGCGAKLAANASPTMKYTPMKDFRVDNTKAPCCSQCAETGGTCTHEHERPDMPNTNAAMDSKDANTKDKKKKKGDPKAYEEATIANTIAGGVTLSDARDSVCCALKDAGYGTYTYVIAMTTDKVVYQMYDMFSGEYKTWQMSYSVASDGSVTLGDDAEEVRLMTSIVAVNESGSNPTAETGEADMPNANSQPGGTTSPAPAANTTPTPGVVTLKNDQGTLEITTNEKGEQSFKLIPNAANEAPKPQTPEQYIASAPAAFQEVLQSSLKLHSERKAQNIKALMDSGRCKFTKESLEAMSMDILDNMLELANVPSFEGRALPVSAFAAGEDDEGYTPAPQVFEAPRAA
jgi:hypothetical protein